VPWITHRPRRGHDSLAARIAGYDTLSQTDRQARCLACGFPTWICMTWGCSPRRAAGEAPATEEVVDRRPRHS